MYRTLITSFILALSLLFISCDSVSDSNSVSSATSPEAFERTGNAFNNGPNGSGTIYQIASNLDLTVASAIEITGLENVFNGRKQFTVFAPSNAAFNTFLTENGITLNEFTSAEQIDAVREVLLYHVVKGNKQANAVVNSQQLFSLQETFIKVNLDNGPAVGNEENGYAPIIQTDIDASNGVIHIIDRVMVPPTEFNPGNSNN